MMDSKEYASPVFSPFMGMGGPTKAIPSFQVSAFPAFFVVNPSPSGAHVRRIHVGLEACAIGLRPQGTQRAQRRNLVFAKHLQVLDLWFSKGASCVRVSTPITALLNSPARRLVAAHFSLP